MSPAVTPVFVMPEARCSGAQARVTTPIHVIGHDCGWCGSRCASLRSYLRSSHVAAVSVSEVKIEAHGCGCVARALPFQHDTAMPIGAAAHAASQVRHVVGVAVALDCAEDDEVGTNGGREKSERETRPSHSRGGVGPQGPVRRPSHVVRAPCTPRTAFRRSGMFREAHPLPEASPPESCPPLY